MFRDSPAFYKDNSFIEAISKPGVFSQFFYEGTYLKMDQLFYEGWTEKVSQRLNISKGLFFSIFLEELYDSIQNLKGFKCFDHAMGKLAEVKDDFLPTVFEVEMSYYLLNILKGAIEEIEFEGCFKTKAGQEIDFRTKVLGNWVYFEMTKVIDYSKCDVMLKLYNLLSAFLIGIRYKTKKSLEMKLRFATIPDQSTINSAIDRISECLSSNVFNTSETLEKFSFSVKEVANDPKFMLSIPPDIELNKLKDKYFEELEHFDEDEINVVAVDTTYLPGEAETHIEMIEQVFETESKLSPIAAVILKTKQHLVKDNGLSLKTLVKIGIKWNKYCKKEKTDFLRKIF